VATFLGSLQALGKHRYSEIREVAAAYIDRRDSLEPIPPGELQRRLADGRVTLIDVRPADEYAAGHIPGAVSLPLSQLGRRLKELPRRREIIAYCRGPYCVFAVEAVELLRRRGFRARRLAESISDWRARGYAVGRSASGGSGAC
jgi:ArsR family transcriptional regulator